MVAIMNFSHLQFDTTTLRQPLVSSHDPLLRYAEDAPGRVVPLTLYYDSTPFQGTTFEQTEASVIFTQYENGLMNGEEYVFDERGTCRKITLYEDSDDIGEQSWHENGQMQEYSRRGEGNKFWNERGVLVYERRIFSAESGSITEYYDTGGIKSHFQTGIPDKRYTSYYFRDGSEMMKEHWQTDSRAKHYEYNIEAIRKNFRELLPFWETSDTILPSAKERKTVLLAMLRAFEKESFEGKDDILRYLAADMDLSHLQYNISHFRQPIRHEYDPEFNYDDGLNINYNHIPLFFGYGVKFSGTYLESSDEHWRLTEYEDGLENGKSCYFYKNGVLGAESYFRDGEIYESKSWYENGQIEEEFKEGVGSKSWNEHGLLTFHHEVLSPTLQRWYGYYQSGNVRFFSIVEKQKDDREEYYFQDGSRMYAVVAPFDSQEKNYEFSFEAIVKNVAELRPFAEDSDSIFVSSQNRSATLLKMLESLEESSFEGKHEILRYFAADATVAVAKKAMKILEAQK